MQFKEYFFVLVLLSVLMGCWCKPAVEPTTKAADLAETSVSDRQLKIHESLPLGIIGGIEKVYLENIPFPVTAKVDTGADTCSVSATKVKLFERDGRKWVSFALLTGQPERPEVVFERPVQRKSKVKRHGAESLSRPVVALKIRLGEMTLLRDFSLTDRSNFKYPVLIGQNLLKGVAAVDVSRQLVLGD